MLERERARAWGKWNSAFPAIPSLNPAAPLPATVVVSPEVEEEWQCVKQPPPQGRSPSQHLPVRRSLATADTLATRRLVLCSTSRGLPAQAAGAMLRCNTLASAHTCRELYFPDPMVPGVLLQR